MRCPYCGESDDKVIDSRAADAGRSVRRRRECLNCNKRFTTYERPEDNVRLTVVKKDKTRVPYDRSKLLAGLEKACYKRPVSAEKLARLVDEVEEELLKRGEREVEAVEIGRIVSNRLKHIDKVAYVRFASVYKDFKDIDDLLDEVQEMLASAASEQPGQGKLF